MPSIDLSIQQLLPVGGLPRVVYLQKVCVSVLVRVCVRVSVCMCVCVCVWEREREGGTCCWWWHVELQIVRESFNTQNEMEAINTTEESLHNSILRWRIFQSELFWKNIFFVKKICWSKFKLQGPYSSIDNRQKQTKSLKSFYIVIAYTVETDEKGVTKDNVDIQTDRQRKLFNLQKVVEFQREIFICRFSRIFGFYGRVSWVQFRPFSGHKNFAKNPFQEVKSILLCLSALNIRTFVAFDFDL